MALALPRDLFLLLVCLTATTAELDVSVLVDRLSDTCLAGASRSGVNQELKTGQKLITDKLDQLARDIEKKQQDVAQETSSKLQSISAKLERLQTQPAVPSNTQRGCPSGWSHHLSYCYYIPAASANGIQALSHCARLDPRARLASVHPHTSTFIHQLLTDHGGIGVWIGLVRVDSDSWEWSDGSPVDYTRWASSEPSNARGKEDCVWMRANGQWNDYDCVGGDSTDRYLCQISLA